MSPRVLVSMVTYNSAQYLQGCLESLKAQSYLDAEVRLWDNASADRTVEIAAEHCAFLGSAHFSGENIGFCAAHNRVIASTDSDYVLVLNPDVILDPWFLEVLVNALDLDPMAGSATGKLWRLHGEGEPGRAPAESPVGGAEGIPPFGSLGSENRILDTTGIYFTRNQRHLDRGAGERDSGQYQKREYVFGASGAAAFYRRTMLNNVKAGSEYFDEAFFAYREDADLAWRAQWLGWRCLYIPEAQGYHARRVLPERRSRLPAEINMHSFKNRFLLRIKNMDLQTYLLFFVPITLRDAAALGYVLLREWSSLRAIPLLLANLPSAWSIRRALRRHRRISPREMRQWFSNRPAARPALPL